MKKRFTDEKIAHALNFEPELIRRHLQEAVAEYLCGGHSIYASEAERKRVQYDEIAHSFKAWNAGGPCFYPGCLEKSIRHSHTIQKSGPLKAIAIKGKVLTPRFYPESAQIRLIERGIAQASVFPGFCKEHERLFEKFENAKSLVTDHAVVLQIFRSICHEVAWLEHSLAGIDRLGKNYLQRRNRSITQLLRKRLGSAWAASHELWLPHLKIDADPTAQLLVEAKTRYQETLDQLREFLKEIELDLAGSFDSALSATKITANFFLPVTLAGVGSYYVQDGEKVKRILALTGVFPNAESQVTEILFCGHSRDSDHIQSYIQYFGSNPLDVINMVEQIMIRGTDRWFISPDLWKEKPVEEQERILAEILIADKGLTHPLNYSLFDSVRRAIIERSEAIHAPGNIERAAILAREKSKLSKVSVEG
jgi:hypothetical protein